MCFFPHIHTSAVAVDQISGGQCAVRGDILLLCCSEAEVVTEQRIIMKTTTEPAILLLKL